MASRPGAVLKSSLLGLVALGALIASPSLAVSREDCAACHEEPAKAFKSIHGTLQCIDCHEGLKGKEIPHDPGPYPVNCAKCHAGPAAKEMKSLHGKAAAAGDQLAPKCFNCHGSHEITALNDPASPVSPIRIPFVCGACHREGTKVQKQRNIHQQNIIENYSESIHGEGLLRKGLITSASCVSCHTGHNILPHTDPNSSIARANIAKTCMKCHALIEQVHRKVVSGGLWEKQPHMVPACVECHEPHKARKVYYDEGLADRDCLKCHGQPGFKSAKGRSLHVSSSEVRGSVHKKATCVKCHTGVAPSRDRPCETVAPRVNCSICHNDQMRQYATSQHGQMAEEGNKNAPTCRDCHGTHGTMSKKDSASPTFPMNVPALCARCHREGEKAAKLYKGTQHEITKHYTESIHGKGLLKSGLVVTATCTSCHTAHAEKRSADPDSSVNKHRIAQTCGQCHHGVFEQFMKSVHSPGITKTDKELPACINCHPAHTASRTDRDNFRMEIMARCGSCHKETAKSYFETYHGKVSQLGYAKTAKCHDCHGIHDILKASDPRSHLSRANVVATCQKCHPGATRKFAGYFTHATHHEKVKYPLLFWSFWGMTALLVGTFGFFGVHVLLWVPRAFQMRRKIREETAAHPHGGKQIQRFRLFDRVMHITLIISFISLALTGMSLKFSYTPWAGVLARLLGGFQTAGFVHRCAAGIMIGLFLTHLWDLLYKRLAGLGGVKGLLFGSRSMLPSLRDLNDFIGTVKWFLGRGPRPEYGRWTYWEKFDYFAVFWGVAIIGSTGLLLWFPEIFTRLLPGWVINIATIIHSDEALLAVGFIFTVHIFNTHLRPDKFPMDPVIFTGRMPLEEFKHDRPAEYREAVASGKLDEVTVESIDPKAEKWLKIFGWCALTIGICLVLGIIYAMIFSYR